MRHDLSDLDAFLAAGDDDGYLVDADSTDSDQYYLSGFDAPDPFLTLYDGTVHLLFARSLEYARAKRESNAATVERFVDYDRSEYAAEHGREAARGYVLADFLAAHEVESVAVPRRFPLETADALRERGHSVTADREDTLIGIRATKTESEIEHVRTAQRANEEAMAAAEDLIATASVRGGTLYHDDEPLTSEAVKREIEVTLLRHGCGLDETIVACGSDAADPHERGSGPLAADEPIIVDIFPQHKTSKYHADMTRTFLSGDPDARVREWYDLTSEAKKAGLAAVEPGATGADVHDAVCDVYEAAGVPTLRADESTETGFIHSTGHGVGLDVHERPRLAPGGEELEPGQVITVEPGLYAPDVGGVRLEDLVVVAEDGYENLTDYHQELVV